MTIKVLSNRETIRERFSVKETTKIDTGCYLLSRFPKRQKKFSKTFLLIPGIAYMLVLCEMLILVLKNNKSLKDHLVHSVLPMPGKEKGSCKPYVNRCQISNSIEETSTFSHSTTNETFKITKGYLNCNSKYAVYLIESKTCD